jgi:adenosine 3'-phospho 5'-phosphosulfate transporter B2
VCTGKTYPLYEYVLAALMSLGVAMFLFARAEEDGSATEELGTTTTGGAVLLIGYMVFDSFTSNYQSLLFKEHKMSSYQMMLGINVFSCFFTFWAMLQQGSLLSCITFSLEHPTFMWHNLILSLTSATGQVFIFRTLSLYGTLVFAIVMTTFVGFVGVWLLYCSLHQSN